MNGIWPPQAQKLKKKCARPRGSRAPQRLRTPRAGASFTKCVRRLSGIIVSDAPHVRVSTAPSGPADPGPWQTIAIAHRPGHLRLACVPATAAVLWAHMYPPFRPAKTALLRSTSASSWPGSEASRETSCGLRARERSRFCGALPARGEERGEGVLWNHGIMNHESEVIRVRWRTRSRATAHSVGALEAITLSPSEIPRSGAVNH